MNENQKTSQLGVRYLSIKYRSFSNNIHSKKLSLNSQEISFLKPTNSSHLSKSLSKCKNLQQSLNPFYNKPNQRKKYQPFTKSQAQTNKLLRRTISGKKSNLSFQENPQQKVSYDEFIHKSSYLEFFESHMSLQSQKKIIPRQKLGPICNKVNSLKNRFKSQRITLPNIIQDAESTFTILDPLFLPIAHIQGEIEKVRKGIIQPRNQLETIRIKMGQLRDFFQLDLKHTQKQIKDKIRELGKSLKQNIVEQQSIKREFRSQVTQLVPEVPQLRKELIFLHQKQLHLQQQIFSSSPFQLQLTPFEGENSKENNEDNWPEKTLLYF